MPVAYDMHGRFTFTVFIALIVRLKTEYLSHTDRRCTCMFSNPPSTSTSTLARLWLGLGSGCRDPPLEAWFSITERTTRRLHHNPHPTSPSHPRPPPSYLHLRASNRLLLLFTLCDSLASPSPSPSLQRA
ncbi:Uncharacterized protein HZ326_12027 [Fusarium oxysporum f. sp. albedinis]|nr:Uncharacterized protein HZ326_12027 [Fusarium oxysporum f. sp. albedinis]